VDGTHVRVTLSATATPLNGKNPVTCGIFYRASSDTAWVEAASLTHKEYILQASKLLLTPTFDALRSYSLKVRIQDYFHAVEQTIPIGTKHVLMDFFHDGTGLALGKVAESPGKVEVGLPLSLFEPLAVDQGGTGARTAGVAACDNLGAVRRYRGTADEYLLLRGGSTSWNNPMIDMVTAKGRAVYHILIDAYNTGIASFAAARDGDRKNLRALRVFHADSSASLDKALQLMDVAEGAQTAHRVFHTGMATPIPVKNGGTGATTIAEALANLGVIIRDKKPPDSEGEDGMICLVPY
jgi:hypothetical protein